MQKPLKTTCFGEILWDRFPDGKALGGAPLNVALRLLSLGAESTIISRLGNDELAIETHQALQDFGLDQKFIQTDYSLETGIVDVQLNNAGSASYIIKKPVAWDAIGLSEKNTAQVAASDLLIFGSLACRSTTSKETLYELIKLAKKTVFDVNLRDPHYELEEVCELLKKADVIKMNDDELEEICLFLDFPIEQLHDGLNFLSQKIGTKTLCVTRGGEGALLLHNGTFYSCNGYPTQVVDTVGAGDSFLAGLLYILFTENDPQRALQFGCALGALVAGRKGANAQIENREIMAKIGQK